EQSPASAQGCGSTGDTLLAQGQEAQDGECQKTLAVRSQESLVHVGSPLELPNIKATPVPKGGWGRCDPSQGRFGAVSSSETAGVLPGGLIRDTYVVSRQHPACHAHLG